MIKARFINASKLVCNNILTKLKDDFLVGIEHTRRISENSVLPITESKNRLIANELSDQEKLKVVLNDPKFGKFLTL